MRIIKFSTFLVLLILLTALPMRAQITLTANPENPITEIGNDISVIVQAEVNSQPVDAANVLLEFDTALLEVRSVQAGTDLAIAVAPISFDNEAGTISYSYEGFVSIANGAFTLFVVTFRAKDLGNASIDFASNNELTTDVLFGGNSVLENAIGDEIVITNNTCDAAPVDNVRIRISGKITEDQTWCPARGEYILDGFVYVNFGVALNIEPGTVIRGAATPSNGDAGSALIISPGGNIIARGTASDPIIFTAENDNLNDPFDLGVADQGLWGGVYILGFADLNTDEATQNLENIPGSSFGGSTNTDVSGTMRFCSIRHAGAAVGDNNDLGALTLAATGSGTQLSQIEVFASGNDGIKWLGGTCNVKNAAVSYSADDAFDISLGATFNGQFWFAMGAEISGTDQAADHRGSIGFPTNQPLSIPTISNVTYIGNGTGLTGQQEIISFRDGAGGRYFNAIICDQTAGIGIEADYDVGFSSNTLLQTGSIQLRNSSLGGGLLFIPNIAFTVLPSGEDFDSSDIGDNNNLNLFRSVALNTFSVSQNELSNTGCPIISLNREDNSNGLDPRVTTNADVAPFEGNLSDSFFTPVFYRGAFAPSASDFWAGWTHLTERNILSSGL